MLKLENNIALGIIDAQRGFMPVEEGERLDRLGFGQLPVPGGHKIVNEIGKIARILIPTDDRINGPGGVVFTTQDWHPVNTAHFSENPNYTTTWPVHCVANTHGAELHPDLEGITRYGFYKGNEVLVDGADDTSYSGYNARGFTNEQSLPDFLSDKKVSVLILAGLALDYCVKATALDFAEKTDMDIYVAEDATKPVAEDTGRQAIDEMHEAGIKIAATAEIIQLMRNGELL
jgi:nicotinamidase/pyrazinamidase